MIKILHVISNLTIDSGVTSFVMNYYQNIDRVKVQFDFLYFEKVDKEILNQIEDLNGNIYYISKPSLKHIIKTYKEFDKFFKENTNKYTAVHLHEVYLVHFIKHFCDKYGIKHLITHAHTTKYSDNPKNALRNRIMCMGLKKAATDYFACSKAAGEFYYGKQAVESGLVKIIPNAIDLEKYKFNESIRKKVRKELNIENKFVVGHIGRMAKQKNQIFLLKVFQKVHQVNSNAVLLMVGDGPLRNEIEKEILKLDLKENVRLLGVRNDVPNLLMAMDIFVLPSLYEGLPVVCVEAQATGLKCVLSENITKEMDCGYCKFIDLNKSIYFWSECINSYINIERKRDINDCCIKVDSYNILKTSDDLLKLYLSLSRS